MLIFCHIVKCFCYFENFVLRVDLSWYLLIFLAYLMNTCKLLKNSFMSVVAVFVDLYLIFCLVHICSHGQQLLLLVAKEKQWIFNKSVGMALVKSKFIKNYIKFHTNHPTGPRNAQKNNWTQKNKNKIIEHKKKEKTIFSKKKMFT